MKTRAWKQNAAIAARHRRAAKAAHRRNRGKWTGCDGEQKHNAMKAAFKAFLLETHSEAIRPLKTPFSPFSVSTAMWRSERAKSNAETTSNPRDLTAWSNRKARLAA